jgi:hypothetical protein
VPRRAQQLLQIPPPAQSSEGSCFDRHLCCAVLCCAAVHVHLAESFFSSSQRWLEKAGVGRPWNEAFPSCILAVGGKDLLAFVSELERFDRHLCCAAVHVHLA